MNDDVERINAEIDRLALKTTDPKPMELFVEREKLRNRSKTWKSASVAVAIVAGIVAYFAFFTESDFGVVEAGVVAVVVMFLVLMLARHDIGTRMESWLARARQVVGG